jgi:hypothetical protein
MSAPPDATQPSNNGESRLVTWQEVARRLRIKDRTLYDKVNDLKRKYPGVHWYFKVARKRVLTEPDFNRLREALRAEWSNSMPQAQGEETKPTSHAAKSMAGSTRSERTRETRARRERLGIGSKKTSGKVISLETRKASET